MLQSMPVAADMAWSDTVLPVCTTDTMLAPPIATEIGSVQAVKTPSAKTAPSGRSAGIFADRRPILICCGSFGIPASSSTRQSMLFRTT
jgi:hypothetical protein